MIYYIDIFCIESIEIITLTVTCIQLYNNETFTI